MLKINFSPEDDADYTDKKIGPAPSPFLLRTPFVPHSVLLRSRCGPMDRRWSVENADRVGKGNGHLRIRRLFCSFALGNQ